MPRPSDQAHPGVDDLPPIAPHQVRPSAGDAAYVEPAKHQAHPK